jgi:TPR repeat protein
LYQLGKDVPQDYARAASFYQSAIDPDKRVLKNKPSVLNAEKPYYKAAGALGRLYYFGRGVEKDLDLAIQLLEKSAELDSLDAILLLAYIYENRQDGRYDMKKAISYQKAAAEQDHVSTIFRLGTYNMIVTSDYEAALLYFRKGESLDHGESVFRLAYMIEKGWGLPADKTAAKLKYAKADELGFSFVQQAEEIRRYGR